MKCVCVYQQQLWFLSNSRSIAIDLPFSVRRSAGLLIDQCCTLYTVGSVPVFIRKMKLGWPEGGGGGGGEKGFLRLRMFPLFFTTSNRIQDKEAN